MYLLLKTATSRVVPLLCLLATIAAIRSLSSRAANRLALPLDGRWAPTSLRGDTTALLPLSGGRAGLLAATTNGVWRSGDGGTSWQRDGSGLDGHAVFALAGTSNGDDTWAGSFDGSVYMRGSIRGKVTWRRISPTLVSEPSYGAVPVYSLAVLPAQGHPLLAGSLGAIFRGDPIGDGRTWRWHRVWQPTAGTGGRAGGAPVTSLLPAPWNPDQILACVFESSPPVLVSGDDGLHWTPAARNLPALLPVQDLAAGKSPARQVYLTTMGGGVWQRAADGRWHDISLGLPQRHAMQLLVAQATDPVVLYAGTMASGVFERAGESRWRSLGRGLSGPAATVIGLAETPGPLPTLIAATSAGAYRYLPQVST